MISFLKKRSSYNYHSPLSSRRKRRVPRPVRWGGLFVLLGIAWSLYCLAEIGSVERSSAVITAVFDSEPKDVGIVLGAALWGDVPSPGLEERLQQALRDYKAGKFSSLILTGGRDTPESKYTEAEGMANYLEKYGVPRSVMVLENHATSTYENLKYSQQLMEENHWTSSVIITHTFHGNRALEVAEALDYVHPKLSLTDSQVLKPLPNTLREVLAYSKWKMDQLSLAFGWK